MSLQNILFSCDHKKKTTLSTFCLLASGDKNVLEHLQPTSTDLSFSHMWELRAQNEQERQEK